METWQSWFNAPDLKSDEGASPPGVRIPAFPPVTKGTLRSVFFYVGERIGDLKLEVVFTSERWTG